MVRMSVVEHKRVILAALGVVAVPTLILQLMRFVSIRPVPADWSLLFQAAVVAFLIVIPLALLSARLRIQRLRSFITAWFVVGLIAAVAWRVGQVGLAWLSGGAPYPALELLDSTRPYYIGQAIPDAFGLAAMGAAIWSLAFWKPQDSTNAWIQRLSFGQVKPHPVTAKIVSAVVLFSLLAACMLFASSIVVPG